MKFPQIVTLTTGGESYILSRSVFDRAGRTVQSASDNTAISTMAYDGASRAIQSTDPLGNITHTTFDNNGNAVLTSRVEVCDLYAHTEVFRSAAMYDCMNRAIAQLAQGPDGALDLVLTPSAPWHLMPSTIVSVTGYDSRSNVTVQVDPKGNTVQMAYDGASRMIESTQHMRKSGGGDQPPQPSTQGSSQTVIAKLPGAAPITSSGGGTFLPGSSSVIRTQTIYDANSRVVALIDDNGGTTNYTYDAHNRQLTMQFADGATRTNAYNPCSDVMTYTDEAGNLFTNEYDSLGRRLSVEVTQAPETLFVGSKEQTFQYDGAGRKTLIINIGEDTDEDAIVTIVYDSLSRVLEECQTYDAEARYFTATKFVSLRQTQRVYPDDAEANWTHDPLYRMVTADRPGEEPDPIPTAAWTYAGPGRVAEVVLKNGLCCTMLNNTRTGSVVQQMVEDSGNTYRPIPAFGSATSDRLGYDGSGRMVAKRFISSSVDENGAYVDTTPVVGFTTSFDRAGNKYYERLLHAEDRSQLYQPYPWSYGKPSTPQPGSTAVFGVTSLYPPGYDPNASGIDSANRLRQYQRGRLAGPIYGYLPTGALPGTPGSGGHAITTVIDVPGTDSFKNYTLDGLGNWESTASVESGEEVTLVEKRNHNLLNQITRRKVGEAAWVDFVYDKNGNLLDDGVRIMRYDVFNRLVDVYRKSDNELVAHYVYDANPMRRVLKIVTNGGINGDEAGEEVPNGTTRYLYAEGTWQVCQEEALIGETWTPTKQNLWGLYIDELIQLRLIEPAGPQELDPGDYYPLQDLLYRTGCLTNDEGEIVEAYDYDAYGNTIIFTEPGTGGNWWAEDADQSSYGVNNTLWCGYRYDFENHLYISRFRYYSLDTERWTTKDLLTGVTNSYQYTRGRIGIDPSGLKDEGNALDSEWPVDTTLAAMPGKNKAGDYDEAEILFYNDFKDNKWSRNKLEADPNEVIFVRSTQDANEKLLERLQYDYRVNQKVNRREQKMGTALSILLRDRLCKLPCLRNLNLVFHGGPPGINVGSMAERESEDPFLTQSWLGPNHVGYLESSVSRGDHYFHGLDKLFYKVRFCKDCTITFRTCNLGGSRVGRMFMKAVRERTGCKVVAYCSKAFYIPGSRILPRADDPYIIE